MLSVIDPVAGVLLRQSHVSKSNQGTPTHCHNLPAERL